MELNNVVFLSISESLAGDETMLPLVISQCNADSESYIYISWMVVPTLEVT